MKILLFGGTTEGRVLAQRLTQCGAEVTVCVATLLGAEALRDSSGITVLTGRRDEQEIAALLPGVALCIDATHPYAAQATANIRAACRAAGVPLRRLLRPESASAGAGAVRVQSCAEAAAFLAAQPGNVLLATGAKELQAFAPLEKGRLFARVLPTHEGVAACEALGIPHKNILALQGPFSQKLNTALLEQYAIAWLVTKDGGKMGGFDEKLAAAQSSGARVILVGRPADAGESMETILESVQEVLACTLR